MFPKVGIILSCEEEGCWVPERVLGAVYGSLHWFLRPSFHLCYPCPRVHGTALATSLSPAFTGHLYSPSACYVLWAQGCSLKKKTKSTEIPAVLDLTGALCSR